MLQIRNKLLHGNSTPSLNSSYIQLTLLLLLSHQSVQPASHTLTWLMCSPHFLDNMMIVWHTGTHINCSSHTHWVRVLKTHCEHGPHSCTHWVRVFFCEAKVKIPVDLAFKVKGIKVYFPRFVCYKRHSYSLITQLFIASRIWFQFLILIELVSPAAYKPDRTAQATIVTLITASLAV